MIKVALIDDQVILLEGLKRILESYEDIQVVATGTNGKEAVEIVRSYGVDILLMDIRMPIMNGVDGVKYVKEVNPKVKVVMLTTFEDEEYIIEAIANGASGYLFKDIHYDKLVQALRDVEQGQFLMPPQVATALVKNIHMGRESKAYSTLELTERERQVADMVRDGFTNKQIATALFISEGTVKNYVSNLYTKTETNDRIGLIEVLKQS